MPQTIRTAMIPAVRGTDNRYTGRSTMPASHRPGRLHIAVLVTLTAAIAYAGYHFYTEQKRVIDLELRRQLAEVADLKMNQVAAWRRERVGDATVTIADARLIPEVQQVLASKDNPGVRQRVLAWMDAMRTNYQYSNLVLSGVDGAIRLTSGQLMGTLQLYAELAAEAAGTERVVFHEVRGEGVSARPQFVLGVGLRSDRGVPIGTMLLGIDPWVALYPLILKWPTSSRTGETVLVRRDNDQVLYLSDPAREPGAAMRLRNRLEDRASPVAKAVLGQEGLTDGIDEDGVAVLASARHIPESDWFVVAKIGKDEAYAPLRESGMRILAISGLLVLLSGAAGGLMWRNQVSAFYRHRFEAEQERRALLGHYDYLTRYANDAILLLDQGGSIIEANERATDIFGYSAEELLQMNVRDLKDPAALADFEKTWDALQRQGGLVFETTNRRKNGVDFPTEISSRVIEVEGRKYCQSIVRDITERQQTEAQIRRLNRLYAVLSHCGQAVVQARTESALFDELCRIAAELGGFQVALISMVDSATQRVIPIARGGASAAYADSITLMASNEPLGRGPAGRAIRERRAVVTNDLLNDPSMAPWREEAARYGLRSSIALPLRRGGAEIGHMGLYSSELGFFNDQETALASEIGDAISHALDNLEQERQRRLAEAELQKNRARLELILDASDEGYWDWNMVTGEAIHSPRYDTMLGYQPGELQTGYATWRERVHPEDLAPTEEFFQAFMESGEETHSREFRMRRKSGDYIWILSRGKVVERDANGKPVRMVGTNTDVTGQKKLQEQFLQAQKLESVGRLAGGIAHDFNNLLTVINGYSALLLRRLPPQSPHLKQVEEILDAGEQAAGLTQQLLVFSRRQKIQPQLMNLNDAVAKARKMLGRMLGEDIELNTALGAERDEVMADPGQIHQVLMNLVVNARDAMPDGGRLILATRNVSVSPGDFVEEEGILCGPYVLLQVTDTGIGMDKETCRQIFEPFFTTKDEGKGTGLGLSTVYGIVGQTGGFIRVESEVAKGTTFQVYLPITAASVPTGSSKTRGANLSGSETILLVEDQESVRVLAVETLTSYGYSVIGAPNADEALALAELLAEPIHLLLTDVVMPGPNGSILAERIKASRPGTRILYMSGYTDEAVGPVGIRDAGAAYLQKPFAPQTLAAKVREVLDAHVSRRTILVVDDQSGVRTLLHELLTSAGYRVLVATSGKEALETLATADAVDLIITDLVMPGKGGIETLQDIRRRHPKMKIIAMSGAFGGQFLSTAELLGATATLAKPINEETLFQTICKVFDSI